MPDTLHLEVATPEQLLIDEQVTQAVLPGQNGYLGILPGHAALLSALAPGVLTYEGGGAGPHVLAIDGGFVEVFENNVRVLADHAEFAQDIQTDRAQEDLAQANDALRHADNPDAVNAAMTAIQQAQAKLDAAQRK